MFLILLKLFDDFGYACTLLQRFLRFLLVLPEIFGADFFFQRNQFLLLGFYFKDNLVDARLCFLLLHTFVLSLDPLLTPLINTNTLTKIERYRIQSPVFV